MSDFNAVNFEKIGNNSIELIFGTIVKIGMGYPSYNLTNINDIQPKKFDLIQLKLIQIFNTQMYINCGIATQSVTMTSTNNQFYEDDLIC